MKRYLCMLALMLILTPYGLCEIDLKSLSDSELQLLIDNAKLEQQVRKSSDNEELIIYEEGGVKLSLTKKYRDLGTKTIYIPFTLINDSPNGVSLMFDNIYANGWKIQYHGNVNAEAGKKMKKDVAFYLDNSDVDRLIDVDTIEIHMHLFETTNYKNLIKTTITLHPNE